MPRTFPWHAAASGVYHNNGGCGVGRRIAEEAQVQGTAGKPLCEHCARLNNAERRRHEKPPR